MKRFLGLVALFVGVVMCASAQVNDTIQRVAGNDRKHSINSPFHSKNVILLL